MGLDKNNNGEVLQDILKELKKISTHLENIESNTSGTEHNVSMLDYKFDEVKNAIKELK